MHDEGVVHGNLKGVRSEPRGYCHACSLPAPKANILINHDGRACLADFSLLTIVSDRLGAVSSCVEGGEIRWMCPELLDPGRFDLRESRPTKKSDCYMLGMAIYEVLSGQAPFAPLSAIPVICKIMDGECPERPQGKRGALFTDGLWGILELCWKYQPEDRTNARAVLQCLERTSLLPPPSYDMDGIVETDTDELSDAMASDSSMFSLFCRRSHAHL